MQHLVAEPVAGVSQQEVVVGEHPGCLALGAEHPRTELVLVSAQVQDQVIKLAGDR